MPDPREPTIDHLNPAQAGALLDALELDGEFDLNPTHPRVAGYVIDALLGAGGGGRVFRATHVSSGAPVAIKVMHSGAGGPSTARALREVEFLQRLRLKGVPRLLEHGVADGHIFVVTEFIDGRSITDHCRKMALPRNERLELLSEVASIVQELHERGIIHRDIKPGNVLIDTMGQPVLLDLGIATLADARMQASLTSANTPIGTPAYMAPEQVTRRDAAVSTRSDVYGLGALAYSVLLSEPPHRAAATVYDQLQQVAEHPPRDPKLLDPTVSRPLRNVLLKCCARDPQSRYATAQAVAEDLRRVILKQPVDAGQPTIWERLSKRIVARPLLSTAICCALMVTSTLVGTVLAVRWINAQPVRLRVDPQRTHFDLVAASGRPVYSLDGQSAKSVLGAFWISGTEGLRWSNDTVVAALGNGTDHPLRNTVFGLTTDRDPTIAWTAPTPVLPDELEYALDGSPPDTGSFALHRIDKVESMPDHAGPEILTVHRHYPHSPAAVRLLDAETGEILCEYWHDGYLLDATFVPASGLIVLVGCNSDGTWRERGIATEDETTYPLVVVAIRPEEGRFGVIQWPGGVGSIKPEWYRCIGPPDLTLSDSNFTVYANSSSDTGMRDEHFELQLQHRNSTKHAAPSCYLVVDSQGNIVRRFTNVNWQQAELFDPERLELIDLPPPIPGSDHFRPPPEPK